MAKIFKVPFAAQGDKTPIPDAAQGDGSVSYNQGFGFDYERPYEDPQSKDIPREGMNQLFNDLSGAVGEIQATGVSQWSPDADPYPIGAIVWRNNQLWQSTAALNAGEPGIASGWSSIDAQRLRDATESVKGVAQIATQAQVNAGLDNSTIVTPKSLRQNSFPPGTRMLFQQSAAPVGWTKDTTHNNKALRIVSGSVSSGGVQPFTTAFASKSVTGSVGSTTLTIAQMPSHNHAMNFYNTTGANTGALGGSGGSSNYRNMSNEGGGGSHTHSFSGTSLDMRVQYVDVIIAQKD